MNSNLSSEQFWAIVVCAVIAYFLLREVFCWYYKINERIKLQNETNDLLKKIISKLENMQELQNQRHEKTN